MIIVLITIKIIIIIPRSSEFPVPGGGRVGLGRPQGVLLGVETGPSGLGLTSIYQSAERGTQRGDSREQMGRRVPLCAGPGQALLQPPERGAFGDTLGLEIRTRLSILISSFSAPPSPAPTLVPGFPWLLWGLTPGARAAWPRYRAAWREGALPKMTLSQQWKEEPISQQCRGWGWRAGGSGPQAHCVGPIKCGS